MMFVVDDVYDHVTLICIECCLNLMITTIVVAVVVVVVDDDDEVDEHVTLMCSDWQ